MASWAPRKGGSIAADYRTPRRKGRDCRNMKLLGSCVHEAKCRFNHDVDSEQTFVKCVPLPDRLSMSVAIGRNGNNLRQCLNKTAGKCVIVPSDKNPREVLVVATNAQLLESVVIKVTDLFGRLYPYAPVWCYLHTEGLKKAGGVVFTSYKGRLPTHYYHDGVMYEVCNAEVPTTASSVDVDTSLQDLSITSGEDSKDTVHKALEEKSVSRSNNQVRIVTDYGTEIKKELEVALECYSRKDEETKYQVLNLKARFGKFLWVGLPEDVAGDEQCITKQQFAEFISTNTKHARVFTTDVLEENAKELGEALEDMGTCTCMPTLETFEFKLSTRDQEKVDVRLKVNQHGKLEVIAVRRSEKRVTCSDLVCLHRNRDIRLCLNQFHVVQIGEPLCDVADRLQQHITVSHPEILFVPCTDVRTINYVRKRKRTTYVIDGKYMITVSLVKEHVVDNPSRQQYCIDFEKCKEHYEIEFHNTAWDCTFGKDAHSTPESCLSPFMGEPVVDPMVLACLPPPGQPWKPKQILKDTDEVLEWLEQINECLGVADH